MDSLVIPAVAIADRIDELPTVKVDDWSGGTLLAEHIASRDHRHVLIKNAPYPPESATARTEAFAEACDRLGVRVTWSTEAVDPAGCLDATELRLLTEGANRATAVMAWSDQVAELVCRSLSSVGIAIPDFVAVVGFDGLFRPYAPRFDLTTVQAPWAGVARTAVRHLATLIAGGSVPRVTTLPVSFYQGRTT